MKAAAAALAALALSGPAAKPIPETRIGLASGGAAEVTAPPRVKENETSPGERSVRPRPYPGAAPAVPHGVADHLPITRDRNDCVDCHGVAEKKRGEPTPIPASHYVDERSAPGQRAAKVVGARWSCTACHLPQHDVRPLVKSPFAR